MAPDIETTCETQATTATLPVESSGSADALFEGVYDRLKAMASRRLAAGNRASLDTTALVHEAYLRMHKGDGEPLAFRDPAQFFAYAARAMRHLLMDRARDRLRLRAGGDWQAVALDGEDERLSCHSAEDAIALDQALLALEATDQRAAKVVELRYFAGLGLEAVASTLSIARSTVDRDWRFARAFLIASLGGKSAPPDPGS